jgi:hypothetical protein
MLKAAPDAISPSALRASAPIASGPDSISYLSTHPEGAGHLLMMTHNLNKIHRHRLAPMAA